MCSKLGKRLKFGILTVFSFLFSPTWLGGHQQTNFEPLRGIYLLEIFCLVYLLASNNHHGQHPTTVRRQKILFAKPYFDLGGLRTDGQFLPKASNYLSFLKNIDKSFRTVKIDVWANKVSDVL